MGAAWWRGCSLGGRAAADPVVVWLRLLRLLRGYSCSGCCVATVALLAEELRLIHYRQHNGSSGDKDYRQHNGSADDKDYRQYNGSSGDKDYRQYNGSSGDKDYRQRNGSSGDEEALA